MPTITDTEYLELEGNVTSWVPLQTPAFELLDLSPLWQRGNKRGSDRLVPHRVGEVGYPRRYTGTRRDVPGAVYGNKDQNGVIYSDMRIGLELNVEYLQTELEDPPDSPLITRTARLHMPDGDVREGEVHVEAIVFAPGRELGPNGLRFVLQLKLLDGYLDLAGS